MRRGMNLSQSRASISALRHRVASILKRQTQHAPQAVFIFNEQDVGHDERQNSESRSPQFRIKTKNGFQPYQFWRSEERRVGKECICGWGMCSLIREVDG